MTTRFSTDSGVLTGSESELRWESRFSLIERDPKERTLSVHRLVQEVVKDVLGEGAERLWAERCVRALNRVFPDMEFKNWAQCERLASHARALLREVGAHDLHFEEAGRLFNQAGFYSNERGRYDEALPLYERSLRIFENAFVDSWEAAGFPL